MRGISLDDPRSDTVRRRIGNHLTLRPQVKTELLLEDYDKALKNATAGDLSGAVIMSKMVLTDPAFRGVFDTYVAGVCSLPKRFKGKQKYIEALEAGHESVRSLFDEMCNHDQLRLMIGDYLMLGVALGELVEVPGRPFKSLQRIDPTYLRYRWSDSQSNWYLNSVIGPIAVMPGDGRWVLWTQGVHAEPWTKGFWVAASVTYIQKTHARLEQINYQRGLANAAIIAQSPQGASEQDRGDILDAAASWGSNTIFSMPPGYEMKLLQGEGTGYETFSDTIKQCNEEFYVLVSGNRVSVQGNTGFSNSSLYETIEEKRVQTTANSLEDLINLQILPQWVVDTYGIQALEECPTVFFDTTPPMDPAQLADSWTKIISALEALKVFAEKHNIPIDYNEIIRMARLPIKLSANVPEPKTLPEQHTEKEEIKIDDISKVISLGTQFGLRPQRDSVESLLLRYGLKSEDIPASTAPTDLAKVIRVDEARGSQGLGPMGDERGQMLVEELSQAFKPNEQTDQSVEQTSV